MFRNVRKVRNRISDEQAKELLRRERRGVLAVNGDDGYPYAVPVNFRYDEDAGKIYFHGAPAGHKADSIRRCDRVCFTVYGNETVKDEPWAPYLQSTVVFGRCRILEDRAETLRCLRFLAEKYYPDAESIENEIRSPDGNAVRIFELTIEHLSGKQVQER